MTINNFYWGKITKVRKFNNCIHCGKRMEVKNFGKKVCDKCGGT